MTDSPRRPIPGTPSHKKARIDALASTASAGTASGSAGGGVATAVSDAGRVASGEGVSLWMSAWRRLRRDWVFLIGAAIVVLFIVLAIVAPLIAPHDPATRVLIEQVHRQTRELEEWRWSHGLS